MNTKLLHDVKQCILADPSQFHMSHWQIPSENSSCGTTGCIAGWAVWLDKPGERNYKNNLSIIPHCDIEPTAQQSLGITKWQGNALFFVYGWPEEFRDEYMDIKHDEKLTVKQKQKRAAKLTARRIEFFIENGY
jgi:hypothetical protein